MISGGVAFLLTFILWKEDASEDDAAAEKNVTVPTENVFTMDAGTVTQPVSGKVIPAKEISDPMFSAETMGPSVGIEPDGEIVYAPFDGSVTMLFPTKHAIGVTSKDGIEVLIHVGVDTVNMNGEGFETFVEQGDKITKGQKLLTFDRKAIEEKGYADTVVVVVTNGASQANLKKSA